MQGYSEYFSKHEVSVKTLSLSIHKISNRWSNGIPKLTSLLTDEQALFSHLRDVPTLCNTWSSKGLLKKAVFENL
jgi:hypothetical protein